jgi:hypothetical protein
MMNTQDRRSVALRRSTRRAAVPAQSPLFSGAQLASLLSVTEDARAADGECDETIAWTQEEIVLLHGILFDTCVEKLGDPETPLDEVLDCLRWIFSEPGKEAAPFSFVSTLRLYQRPHARFVREAIQAGLACYLRQRLMRYPPWVGEAFWSDPDAFAAELERNPQWVNETLRRHSRGQDLFAA